MSAVASVTGQPPIDSTQNQFIAYGTITLSGNYGSANSHGDVLDLSQLGVPSTQVPNCVEIYEAPTAGNAPLGYEFIYAPGPSQQTGQIVITQCAGASSPNSEISEGQAYPAALTAATANIKFRAWFSSGI